MKLLSVIRAYSLYLTSIGDVDKALDPMQWDYMTFWTWRHHYYQVFMKYEVAAKLTVIANDNTKELHWMVPEMIYCTINFILSHNFNGACSIATHYFVKN